MHAWVYMTVGWILEGDRERFLSAVDPAPAPSRRESSFTCPFCSAALPDGRALDGHLAAAHVGARPFLLLDGREPSPDEAVRAWRGDGRAVLFNSTAATCAVDDDAAAPVDGPALATILRTHPRATLRVVLSNRFDHRAEPVITAYRLRVAVPSAAELATVDAHFVRHLGKASPGIGDVDAFVRDAALGVARDYADGLAAYVRGVLCKDKDERTGIRPPYGDYKQCYNRALQLLAPFDRPLPSLLCSLMRFALNDFSRAAALSRFPHLDEANRRLAPLAGAAGPPVPAAPAAGGRKHVDVCPVDMGVDLVLRMAQQLGDAARWAPIVAETARSVAHQRALEPLDRVKILAVWADTALRLGAAATAAEPLHELEGNHPFGAWAAARLSEMST